jgi:regulator of replication initiation timing
MPSCQVRTILRNIPTLYRVDPTSGIKKAQQVEKKPNGSKRNSKTEHRKRLAALAEAIILQSLEDLWSKTQKNKSLAFFTGEGFHICAEMAEMKVMDRIRLFGLLRGLDRRTFDSRHSKKIKLFIKKKINERNLEIA